MLDYHGQRFGSDGVEISAHAISAPDHLPVQGRQFSNEEFCKMQNGMPILPAFKCKMFVAQSDCGFIH